MSGVKVVIVNGRPGVGKTTFEDICEMLMGEAWCRKRSTIDRVKIMADIAFWNHEKALKDRQFLSDLKDLCTKYNDMPFKDVKLTLQDWEDELSYYGVIERPHIFFIDDREPEHIDRIKYELGATTLLIRRPGDERIETSNHADEQVFEYNYDYIINNDGDFNDLVEKARDFINLIFEEKVV